MISSQTTACYQLGVYRRVKRHSFTVSLSTPHTHTLLPTSKSTRGKHGSTVAWKEKHMGLVWNPQTLYLDWMLSRGSGSSDRHALWGRLTCLWANLIQQLHHAFSLHEGPVFDGRAPSDLTVLLLDLWRATLSDERAEFTAEPRTDWRVTPTALVDYIKGQYQLTDCITVE